MTGEEIKILQNKIKFCMAHKISVQLQWGKYYPTALILRWVADKPVYSVEMCDINCENSTITIGLDDVEWPTAGGGYICKE